MELVISGNKSISAKITSFTDDVAKSLSENTANDDYDFTEILEKNKNIIDNIIRDLHFLNISELERIYNDIIKNLLYHLESYKTKGDRLMIIKITNIIWKIQTQIQLYATFIEKNKESELNIVMDESMKFNKFLLEICTESDSLGLSRKAI